MRIYAFFLAATLCTLLSSQDLHFYETGGFGTDGTYGIHGSIYRVTNLNNSGEGSLRHSLEMAGPRLIVFEVGGIIDLEEQNLVPGRPELSQGAGDRRNIAHRIGNDDHQPAPPKLWGDLTEHAAQIGFSFGGIRYQGGQDWPQMGWATSHRDLMTRFVVESDQSDTILLAQHQVSERRGKLLGVVVFAETSGAIAAVAHRTAAIDQQSATEIRFLFVLANVKPVTLGERLPVDIPRLVAGNVGTVLLELDAEALMWRAMSTAAKPLDDLPSEHLQSGNP